MKLRLLILALFFCSTAWASNIYVAQSSAGGNTGADCADARALSTLSGTDEAAGNTIHLCGTFTGSAGSTMLTTVGGGASGNPLTFVWESGSTFTAPYWGASTGAFQINNNYIVVDGQGNGVITATANGTALANQVDSDAFVLGVSANVHDVTIKNMTISNMCVRVAGSSNTTCAGVGIRLLGGGGNIVINGNTMHDISAGVSLAIDVTESGDQIYSNAISNRDAGIIVCTCATSITITNTLVHDNAIGNAANWDDTGDTFHHDGIHFFNSGGSGAETEPQIYNNTFTGGLGVNSTSSIFFENTWSGAVIFNNVILPSSGTVNDGLIFLRGASSNNAGYVVNNVIVNSAGGSCFGLETSQGNTFENNVESGCATGVNVEDTTSQTGFAANGNVYYMVTQWAWLGIVSSLSSWKSTCSCDSSSTASNPNLTAGGVLQAGSSAVGLGSNLTSLSISALDTSAPQTFGVGGGCGVQCFARPATGAWDSGAYQFSQLPATAPAPGMFADNWWLP